MGFKGHGQLIEIWSAKLHGEVPARMSVMSIGTNSTAHLLRVILRWRRVTLTDVICNNNHTTHNHTFLVINNRNNNTFSFFCGMNAQKARQEVFGLFCTKYNVKLEDLGEQIIMSPHPIQHGHASETENATPMSLGVTASQPNDFAVEDIQVKHYANVRDCQTGSEDYGCLRLEAVDSEETNGIAVASSYGKISSILLAIVSQDLAIHTDDEGNCSLQVGAQPPWNARGISTTTISAMFDEKKQNNLLSWYLRKQGTKEREDHEFSLAPYATKENSDGKRALEMPWGSKVHKRGWQECDAGSCRLMAQLYAADNTTNSTTNAAQRLSTANVAKQLSSILQIISEKYEGLTTKAHMQSFVAKLLNISGISVKGAVNWECIHDLVLTAKLLWVGLGLPSFAAIGGRHRLFSLCHILLGWKATGNGSTHDCIVRELPDPLVYYPAPVQIVVGDDKCLLRSFSLQLQHQTQHIIPVKLRDFMIDVLENFQERPKVEITNIGDANDLFWLATLKCLNASQAYRDLTKAIKQMKYSLYSIAKDKSKRHKNKWNEIMKFLMRGKYLFAESDKVDDNAPTMMLRFLRSANVETVLPELTQEVTSDSLAKVEQINTQMKRVIDYLAETLITYYIWSARSTRPKGVNNGDAYLRMIFQHRVGSILVWALEKWGLIIPCIQQSSSCIEPVEPPFKPNLFGYFQRMALLLECGQYKLNHNFDKIKHTSNVKKVKKFTWIPHTTIPDITRCLENTINAPYTPLTVLIIGMVTLKLPPFPFDATEEKQSEATEGSRLSPNELCDWARTSSIQATKASVHVFTISDKKLPNHIYGVHPHLHKISDNKSIDALVEKARVTLEEHGFDGFDQICFNDPDYLNWRETDLVKLQIVQLAGLLKADGALYIPHREGDVMRNQDTQGIALEESNLKAEVCQLDSDHWLWKATEVLPSHLRETCCGSETNIQLKISKVTTKAKEATSPDPEQAPVIQPKDRSNTGGKNVNGKKKQPVSQPKDSSIAGGKKAPVSKPKDSSKAGGKNVSGTEKGGPRKKKRKHNNNNDSVISPQISKTRTNWVTYAEIEDPVVSIHFKNLLYSLLYYYKGGLFTKATLKVFQEKIIEWANGHDKIPLPWLESKIVTRGCFSDDSFHQNAAGPFNFLIARPELIAALATHLNNEDNRDNKAKTMHWKAIGVHNKVTDAEREFSEQNGLPIVAEKKFQHASYSMFSWGNRIPSKPKEDGEKGKKEKLKLNTDEQLPDDWKSRGKSLIDTPLRALIDELALHAAQLIYPGMEGKELGELIESYLVHPGIVQTHRRYHQRLHYDRYNQESGKTFYLHVPLKADGMLLRILPEPQNKTSEFIFVPFGCALAIPVSLAHAGCYGKPGNRRLHIVVTYRNDQNFFEQFDHLNAFEGEIFPKAGEQFNEEAAMKPSPEQKNYSDMYLALLDPEVQKAVSNYSNEEPI